MADQGLLLVQLAYALAAAHDDTPVALRLCRAYAQMFDFDGGAVTLAYTVPEQRLTLCATDATVSRLEHLQEVVGEGPSADAYRSGRPVSGVLDAEATGRWPVLVETAGPELGSLAVYAFPMWANSAVIGVLTCYQSEARPPAHRSEDAHFMADALAAAIVLDDAGTGEVDRANRMERDRIDDRARGGGWPRSASCSRRTYREVSRGGLPVLSRSNEGFR